MKKFLWILFLGINLILLNFCAKPTVVDIVLPSDNKLNCIELENEIMQTQKMRLFILLNTGFLNIKFHAVKLH